MRLKFPVVVFFFLFVFCFVFNLAALGLHEAWRILVVTCGIQFSVQGANPGPLHEERRILATGSPGKSPTLFLTLPKMRKIRTWRKIIIRGLKLLDLVNTPMIYIFFL